MRVCVERIETNDNVILLVSKAYSPHKYTRYTCKISPFSNLFKVTFNVGDVFMVKEGSVLLSFLESSVIPEKSDLGITKVTKRELKKMPKLMEDYHELDLITNEKHTIIRITEEMVHARTWDEVGPYSMYISELDWKYLPDDDELIPSKNKEKVTG